MIRKSRPLFFQVTTSGRLFFFYLTRKTCLFPSHVPKKKTQQANDSAGTQKKIKKEQPSPDTRPTELVWCAKKKSYDGQNQNSSTVPPRCSRPRALLVLFLRSRFPFIRRTAAGRLVWTDNAVEVCDLHLLVSIFDHAVKVPWFFFFVFLNFFLRRATSAGHRHPR